MLLAAVLTVATLTTTVQAQTTNFFDSFAGYFTSFNTNLLTFQQNDRVDFRLGTANVNNQNMRATFGASVNVWKGLAIEADVHNASALGTIVAYEAGAGWSFVKWDTKLTAYLHVGYDVDAASAYVAPGLRVQKALTDHTFAGIGISLDEKFKNRANRTGPTIGIFTGFVF